MSIDSRHALARAASKRYLQVSKAEKTQILNEFCANTGLSRKHGLRMLGKPPESRTKRHRSRTCVYGEFEQLALRRLWPLSGYLSAVRLVEALPPLLDACKRHQEWVPEDSIRIKLLAMSASTCNRLLRDLRRSFPAKTPPSTRAGPYLKSQIAVRLGTDWEEVCPGFVEVDLVAHSGPVAEGIFLHTLTLVDIATGWTELGVLKGKGQIESVSQIGVSSRRMPFPLRGIDSDNGSEFINYHLMEFCLNNSVQLTRSRPYVKNDGCHVEQKNGAIVRKQIGQRRLDSDRQAKALKEIYSVLRLLVNYFEPSSKLTRTPTHDGKVNKHYDKPRTPYQRVLDADQLDDTAKHELQIYYLALNPVALRNRLKCLKRELLEEDLVRILGDLQI